MSTQYLRFSARAAPEPRRSPLLERVLARADESTVVSDWRADAFRVMAPDSQSVPAVGAAALYAARGAVAGQWVFLATPVHYLAEMTKVRLPADGILVLRPMEAENLADDFNRVWHDAGVRIIAGRYSELYCVFEGPLRATTHDPGEMLDRHIDAYLPAGEDAPRLRRLMSEIEMWLFDHAVNRGRSADALLPVNGLWLWGGGPTLESMPPVQGWAAGGTDPFFKLFGEADRAAAAGAGERRAANPAVIVVAESPGDDGWREIEARWLAPALEQLRSRRLARLDLSAGARCYRVSARWTRRFWRRARPWWEAFE